MVDQVLGIELAGVDQLLHLAQVHLGEVLAERIVEPALRQTHVKRHLAAFEALDRYARTALLALLAATAGLALARADSTSDADTRLTGARIVTDVVQFHGGALPSASAGRETSRSLQPCEGAWRSRRAPRACPRARQPGSSCRGRAQSESSSGFPDGGSASRSASS